MAHLGNNPCLHTDYRRHLGREDIDAVAIAVPDHWHALKMAGACDPGKEPFVEKPLSMAIHGNRLERHCAGVAAVGVVGACVVMKPLSRA